MEKNVSVEDLREGQDVDAPFLLGGAELREGRNGKYIDCEISDCTGSLKCKIWGVRGDNAPVEEVFPVVKEGGVFRITGRTNKFNGSCVLNINEGVSGLRAPLEGMNPADYCYAPVDTEAIKQECYTLVNTISDESLSNFVFEVIVGEDGYFEKPAAKYNHHAYRGGLAEHSLEVARLVSAMADSVERTGMDRDLALAGALLHDIGKCRSFESKAFGSSALPAYDLIGHTALGMQILEGHRDRIDPAKYAHLLHIVQSHHGDHAEVRPQTLEAWAVHLADLTSAQLHEVAEDLETVSPGTFNKGAHSHGPVYKF